MSRAGRNATYSQFTPPDTTQLDGRAESVTSGGVNLLLLLALVTAMTAMLLLNEVMSVPLPNTPVSTHPTPSIAIPSQAPQ